MLRMVLRYIELFAGCGGIALGMEKAGFNIKLATDNDKSCCKTLKTNKPEWNVVCDDIAELDFTVYAGDNIDLICGGLPCQPYSTAGLKNGINDPRGILFFEYARVLSEVKPKVFLMENVKGLLTHETGLTYKFMKKHLNGIGYKVREKVLNTHDYGVAQLRERLFIIGIREDVYYEKKKCGVIFEFPHCIPEKDRKVLADVISPEHVVDDTGEGLSYSAIKKYVFARVPEGGCWVNLPPDLQKKYLGNSFNTSGGKRGIAKRLSWDKPCLTLTTSPSQKQTERCHPAEVRPLTIFEYKLIQSFPKTWQMEGNLTAKYKQLGNAVPPKLAKALGLAIKDYLTDPGIGPDATRG